MGRINIDYSNKIIPVPFKDEYEIQSVSKVEKLIKRMRWKALEYLGKLNDSVTETYRSKSRKCPPVVKELLNLEQDLKLIIRNIQYRTIKNKFAKKLVHDVKLIKSSKELFVNISLKTK